MKKIFIIAAMAVAGITTANAQEFKVGAKAGFLMSNVSVDSSSDIEAGKLITSKLNTAFRPGFHFGAFIEYGFNEKIWVEAGVDYAFQGAKLKSVEATVINVSDGSLFASEKANIKNGWLKTQQFNIPLWVKYDISGFRPKVGVNLGFLSKVKGNLEIEGGSAVENKSLTPDKKFDFGLGFGAEYNLPMGLFFDATFNLGLTKLSTKEKNNDGTYSEGGKFKNRVFQIGVGYKF
ncbi:outer membrane beta-barrel protein [Capnocytophaga sputigena]|uniref:TDE1717 family outer membrane beta-barrel protein n=1 Tax=Capnocytophaga sputigena TaxID=1019 RepID=UPI00288C0FAE|nr:outer membrane beta-barrel protein [Capnocytophaga sputigena]